MSKNSEKLHFCSRALACTGILLSTTVAMTAQSASKGWANPPIHIIKPFVSGYSPTEMLRAYGFTRIANQGAGQTVAIVDAYDDPNIEADLGVFNTQFSLPACTTGNGCFKKVYGSGTVPTGDPGWGLEISLDVEWVHAIAPQANIVLVEAASNSLADLMTAVDVAVQNGASVVSMSFGGGESSSELSTDSHFSVPFVTFVASSGDNGHGVEYPAASPYVVGVGGTTLTLNSDGVYVSETAWSGSGGGTSLYETLPAYQQGFVYFRRGIPDVSYDADPNTGVPVYDSYQQTGWIQVGGTSMGSPQWAALFAIVNSSRVAASKQVLNGVLTNLYNLTQDLNDINSGTNGTCPVNCKAKHGYDKVTGIGSPMANQLIPDLVALP